MLDFKYYMPTRIFFGQHPIQTVVDEIVSRKYRKVLIHGSTNIDRYAPGLLSELQTRLQTSGVDSLFLGGVVPNPRLSVAKSGIELCRKENVDFVLAVGGGSAIDSSKCIALGTKYDGDVWDFYCGKANLTECLPVGVILTHAASGSETSDGSVITNEAIWKKRDFGSDALRPKFAFMNPEYTFSLSPKQTAFGVADIIMHTMERYFTPTKNVDLTDGLCEAIIRDTMKNARIVLNDPKHYDARAAIMWAGSICHNGLLSCGRKGDWSTHKIEHAVGGMFDIAHAAGVVAIWGSWARYVAPNNIPRFVKFAVNVMGCKNDPANPERTELDGICAMESFFREIGLFTSFAGLNIRLADKEMDELADEVVIKGAIGNLQKLGKEDVKQILAMSN